MNNQYHLVSYIVFAVTVLLGIVALYVGYQTSRQVPGQIFQVDSPPHLTDQPQPGDDTGGPFDTYDCHGVQSCTCDGWDHCNGEWLDTVCRDHGDNYDVSCGCNDTPSNNSTPPPGGSIPPSVPPTPFTPPPNTTVGYCAETTLLVQSGNSGYTLADQTTLQPGQTVYLGVSGITNSGSFSSARFSIDGGVAQSSTQVVYLGSTQYHLLPYTIPTGATSITVVGEVNHSELGWIGDTGQTTSCQLDISITPPSTLICGESACVDNTDCATNLVCASNGYCAMPAYVSTCESQTNYASNTEAVNACCSPPAFPNLLTCGEAVCVDTSDCATNLVCSSNGYCSMPAYVSTCEAHTDYASHTEAANACCSAPLACQALQAQPRTVNRGDIVSATCDASGTTGVRADFQLLYNNAVIATSTQSATLVQNQAQADFTLSGQDDPGAYLVQCRICDSSNQCTQWGAAQ